jgi:hypothetical protein
LSKVPIINLGVLFDSALSMDAHVSSVVWATSFHLRNEATKLLVQSMV